jgi:hypothetical protein
MLWVRVRIGPRPQAGASSAGIPDGVARQPVDLGRREQVGVHARVLGRNPHPRSRFSELVRLYMWVDVRDRCGGDVKAWALELLRERHVAVAPGTTFGAEGEGWVRISPATDTDDLLEGLDRLAAVTAGH